MEIKDIAKICHQANKAFQEAIGEANVSPHWDDAPEWQKESAEAGVKTKINNPEITPEQLHQKWMDTKHADGWVWGATKNEKLKTHPCMRPYDQLPEVQKVKDQLFGSIIEAVSKAA